MGALPRHSDVVIAGAGPTGLSLALALHHQGIRPLLLDRRVDWPNTSRAGVVHAGTLEALEMLDVTPDLLREGIRVPTFRMRDHDRALMTVDFSHLPTRYPFALMCPQDRTEAILRERLAMQGGVITGDANVTSSRRTRDGMEVTVQTSESIQTITADWLIACDGAHSTVRDTTGIAFEGAGYEQVFVLADVHMTWPLPRTEVSLFLSDDGLLVIAPLPNDRFRMVATVNKAPSKPDVAFMQKLLTGRGPTHDARIDGVIWSSRFHVAHRRAARVVQDRVILCGDAAHVHSPAGGQGMNLGIQDAVSLAWPLVSAMRGGNRGDVERWAARRAEIAKSVISLTDRMTRAASLRSGSMQAMRNLALQLADRMPAVPKALAAQLAQLGKR
ncbi:NAD(P)/FAD-dependent oxidoreductase [Aureimonas sp. ME7]|uniref:FAD-dependent oxidoreductase n=1 Tax=Aureimonas sp. ME7 TaxID=2744252 RepID=UPI0015FCDCE3|nr:NAD(P)/FAD-dependent oxidoreductase [Aureimonas sp. ME7]